ncbi:NUDIX domain-containing protein [Candidatus Woesebacteria bacterium]|nr:NUDIX domain-containing protein [Candidatus Woesebacteria bacterium]
MTTLHRLTEKVKLLQKAVLVHQGKMLILRRSENSKTRANQWDLPGGNSEWPVEKEGIIRDVHIVDLKREILEETNIGADMFATTPKLVSFETCFEAEVDIYTIIAGWRVELEPAFVKENLQLSDEHSECQWISPEEITHFDLGFAGGGEGFITRIIANSFAL